MHIIWYIAKFCQVDIVYGSYSVLEHLKIYCFLYWEYLQTSLWL